MTSQYWGAHLRRPWPTFCRRVLRRRRQPPHAPDLTRSGIFWGAENASLHHPIAKIVRSNRGEMKMVRFLSVPIWGWLIMIIMMEKPVVGQQVRKLENAVQIAFYLKILKI